MKKFIAAIAVAIFMMSNMNVTKAQTVVAAGIAVDMADTSSANADALKGAKAFLKRTGGAATYGASRDITIATGDSMVVCELSNVKSRSGKTETQWGITQYDKNGKVKAEYIVSEADPTDALTDKATCLETANGCGATGSAKVSVKHGDGPKTGQISDLQ